MLGAVAGMDLALATATAKTLCRVAERAGVEYGRLACQNAAIPLSLGVGASCSIFTAGTKNALTAGLIVLI